jgi:hypothetical protein
MGNHGILSQKELSALLGVTDRTIQRWQFAGLPRHGRQRGIFYVLEEVLPWYLDFIADARPPVNEQDELGPHGDRARAFAYLSREIPGILVPKLAGAGETETRHHLERALQVLLRELPRIMTARLLGKDEEGIRRGLEAVFGTLANAVDPREVRCF